MKDKDTTVLMEAYADMGIRPDVSEPNRIEAKIVELENTIREVLKNSTVTPGKQSFIGILRTMLIRTEELKLMLKR